MDKRGQLMTSSAVTLVWTIVKILFVIAILAIVYKFFVKSDTDELTSVNNFKDLSNLLSFLTSSDAEFESRITLFSLPRDYSVVGFSKVKNHVEDNCGALPGGKEYDEWELTFARKILKPAVPECQNGACLCLYKNDGKPIHWQHHLMECESVDADYVFSRNFYYLLQHQKEIHQNVPNVKPYLGPTLFLRFTNEQNFNYYGNEDLNRKSLDPGDYSSDYFKDKNFKNFAGSSLFRDVERFYYYPFEREHKVQPFYGMEEYEELNKELNEKDGKHYGDFIVYGYCGELFPDRRFSGYQYAETKVYSELFDKEALYLEKFEKDDKKYVFIAPESRYTEDRTRYFRASKSNLVSS